MTQEALVAAAAPERGAVPGCSIATVFKSHDQFLLKNRQFSNQQRLAIAQAYVELF